MSQSRRSGSDILVFDISSSDLTENSRIFLSWPQALTSVREPHFAIDLLSTHIHCSTHTHCSIHNQANTNDPNTQHNLTKYRQIHTQTHVYTVHKHTVCW